jgi:hypothetical protein
MLRFYCHVLISVSWSAETSCLFLSISSKSVSQLIVCLSLCQFSERASLLIYSFVQHLPPIHGTAQGQGGLDKLCTSR